MERQDQQKLVDAQRKLLKDRENTIRSLCTAIAALHSSYTTEIKRVIHQSTISHPRNSKRTLIDTTVAEIKKCKNTGQINITEAPETQLIAHFKDKDEDVNNCKLCLFPLKDSLHGSFFPKTYTLACGHTFHLLCIFETIQRRNCRKTCGDCWITISEDDQEVVLKHAKKEKRHIIKYSQSLANELLKFHNETNGR